MGLLRKKKAVIMEEKSQFANTIQEIWKRGNYEKIKVAHNEIVGYLKDEGFDFFSVQYLLTMIGTELLINEYLESHKEELKEQLKNMMGGEQETWQDGKK